MTHKESKVQKLENRVMELEKELAEAQAAAAAVQSSRKLSEQQAPCEKEKSSLLAQEERLQSALMIAPYPLMIRRDDGHVVMVNAAWTEITGYALEDIPTIEEWTRKAYGEQAPQYQSLLLNRRFSQPGIQKWGEFEITTRLGEKRIWDFNTVSLGMDEEGRELVMSMAVDVTERKHAENALRVSEAKYRSLVETAFEGVWTVDTSGRTVFVNRRMAEILKYDSPDDLLNHSAFDFIPPEDLEESMANFRARLNKNNPEQYDVRLRCRDGSIVWASVAANNVLDENATVIGRMALFMDITVRKQAEQALRQSEEKFSRAFQSNPAGMAIIQVADERYTDVNASLCQIVGYNDDELIGRTSLELGFFTKAEHEELMHQFQTQGYIREQELNILTKNRITRRVLFSLDPIEFAGEARASILATMVDITDRKRAEEALAESERRQREISRLLELDQARLAAILQHLPVGIWIADQNGRLIGSNQQAERIWGGEAPLLNNPAEYSTYVAWQPESGELLQPEEYPLAVTLQTGEVVGPIELNIRRFDGTEGTVLVSAAPIKDFQGRLTGAVGVNVDITDRKIASNALQESEERFAKAFRSSPDAMAISRLSDALLLDVNEGWTKLFGYERDEVLTRTALELGIYARLEDRERIIHSLQERGSLKDFEVNVRRKSGEIRQASISAEKIEILAVDCMLIVFRDITEQKKNERAVQESEQRFHSLADSMPQLVWTALADGTVDYYNQRYLEYQDIKQIRTTVWEWAPVLHPDDLEPTVAAWQHSLQTGEVYQSEHRVRMANGSYRWHLSRGVPMLDEKGQVIRWFGTATDIHDLKIAEDKLKDYAERLKRSNQELEQFAFVASHDLQEPLRKIEMFGDLLLQRQTSLSDIERNYLTRIQSAAKRMRDMVEGLLQLSRVTTQGKPFVEVDLAQVTSEVLSDLEEQIRRTGGKVGYDNLPTVEGDPLQIRQLMQNLIGNALKYHEPGGPPEVKIYAKQLPREVQIFVEDNGIGFKQEDAERIFRPFHRLVGRSQYEGSGMGLAICRRIVERHGGNITVVSEPGQGTTFTVTLPLQASDDASASQERI